MLFSRDTCSFPVRDTWFRAGNCVSLQGIGSKNRLFVRDTWFMWKNRVSRIAGRHLLNSTHSGDSGASGLGTGQPCQRCPIRSGMMGKGHRDKDQGRTGQGRTGTWQGRDRSRSQDRGQNRNGTARHTTSACCINRKSLAIKRLQGIWRVPSGIRTHDIQNHNLTL